MLEAAPGIRAGAIFEEICRGHPEIATEVRPTITVDRTTDHGVLRSAGRVSTERAKNSCEINARVGFRVPSVLRVIFRKVRRFGHRKMP